MQGIHNDAMTVRVALALAFSCPAWADTSGLVVSVHDGDTLTVLVEKQQVKVRLAEIDAPELGQAFGQSSRQSLAKLCFQESAKVEQIARDRLALRSWVWRTK